MNKGIKYSILAIVLFSFLFTACTRKEEKIMTKQEMNAKTDSIVASKTADMDREAAEDLDRRKSIEVKAKADSIVNAWQTAHKAPMAPAAPATHITDSTK